MTQPHPQPHPERCETCKNVDCDLHEQGKGNRNPETGYEWDHHYWYHKIIDVVGCASHSSATECPAQAVLDSAIADLEREIKDQQWMIDNYSGHHKEIHESISKALRYSLNLLRGGAHD